MPTTERREKTLTVLTDKYKFVSLCASAAHTSKTWIKRIDVVYIALQKPSTGSPRSRTQPGIYMCVYVRVLKMNHFLSYH